MWKKKHIGLQYLKDVIFTNGDILFDSRKDFYNISVRYISFTTIGVYFVGQDGRVIPAEFVMRKSVWYLTKEKWNGYYRIE